MSWKIQVLSAALLWLAAATHVSGQEFTPAQLEVWRAIEQCQAFYAQEDKEGYLSCVHDDFSGWLYGEPVPRHKSGDVIWSPVQWEQSDTRAYELRPIEIRVHGNVAIAHYYWIWMSTDADGEVTTQRGRWTDVMLRVGDRWLWIADHGGPESGG